MWRHRGAHGADSLRCLRYKPCLRQCTDVELRLQALRAFLRKKEQRVGSAAKTASVPSAIGTRLLSPLLCQLATEPRTSTLSQADREVRLRRAAHSAVCLATLLRFVAFSIPMLVSGHRDV